MGTDLSLKSELEELSQDYAAWESLLLTANPDWFSLLGVYSGEEGAGDAYFTSVQKCSFSRAQAMCLLWAREFVYIEEWDLRRGDTLTDVFEYALSGPYMRECFMKFVKWAKPVPTSSIAALAEISELIQFLQFDQTRSRARQRQRFSVHEAGISFHDYGFRRSLGIEKLFWANRISNEWNDRSFMIETDEVFACFSWGTSA